MKQLVRVFVLIFIIITAFALSSYTVSFYNDYGEVTVIKEFTDSELLNYNNIFLYRRESDGWSEHISIVTALNGDTVNLVIPNCIDGLPVKKICDAAFVPLANTLETVVFNPALREINKEVFKNCYRISALDFTRTSIDYIGYNAFYGCASLKALSLPCVGFIEDFAFEKCYWLEKLYIGYLEKGVGVDPFDKCESLKYAYIANCSPELDLSGGGQTLCHILSGCPSLHAVYMPENVAKLEDTEFCMYKLGHFMMKNYTKAPENLTVYAPDGSYVQAFCGEKNIRSSISFEVEINGRKVPFSQPPVELDGTRYLPVESVIEFFGGTVEWDNKGETAIVNYNGSENTLRSDAPFTCVRDGETNGEYPIAIVNDCIMLAAEAFERLFDLRPEYNPPK